MVGEAAELFDPASRRLAEAMKRYGLTRKTNGVGCDGTSRAHYILPAHTALAHLTAFDRRSRCLAPSFLWNRWVFPVRSARSA